MVWERTRTMLRLRAALREYFPGALVALDELGLAGPDTLELLQLAPAPDLAAEPQTELAAALKRARRRNIVVKIERIVAALRAEQLGRSATVTIAYAATVSALAAVIAVLNVQIKHVESQVETHFLQHPHAKIYLSQSGIGVITGARVLAEFSDDADRYASAKARKNDVLAVERKERARIRSEKGVRWGGRSGLAA